MIAASVFRQVYESAIRDVHRTVFLGDIDTFTVQLTDMILIVKKQAAVLSPELSDQIPDDLIDTLIDVQSNPLVLDAVQIAENIRLLAFALPLVAFTAFGSSIFLTDNRRQARVARGHGCRRHRRDRSGHRVGGRLANRTWFRGRGGARCRQRFLERLCR